MTTTGVIFVLFAALAATKPAATQSTTKPAPDASAQRAIDAYLAEQDRHYQVRRSILESQVQISNRMKAEAEKRIPPDEDGIESAKGLLQHTRNRLARLDELKPRKVYFYASAGYTPTRDGICGYAREVQLVRRIDPDTALVRIAVDGADNPVELLLKGFNTSDVADGEAVPLTLPLMIGKPSEYKTDSGEVRRIRTARPLDIESYIGPQKDAPPP